MLTFEEARVLGCLLEKEVTTPDYYPMTQNGLVVAASQKSNRSPVVEFDDSTIENALTGLRRKRLAMMIQVAGSRAPKFKHTLQQVLGSLDAPEIAILTELLLRNVQTLGELRTRTERMHLFSDLTACELSLNKLVNYGVEPLVAVLPPGGGRRVKAYAHLLCGPVDAGAPVVIGSAAVEVPPPEDWKAVVNAELAALRAEVDSLKAQLQKLQGELGVG